MSGHGSDDWASDYYNPLERGRPGLWLFLSIVGTLCCCAPFGIPGIVFSAMAISDRLHGRNFEYEDHLGKARTWTIIVIVGGFLLELGLFVSGHGTIWNSDRGSIWNGVDGY